MNRIAKTAILLLTIGLTINFAAASTADLDIFPKESSTRIDSFTSYEVTVTNTGTVEDVYDLSSSHTSETTIAPRQVPEGGTLEPGESSTVQVWFNPDLDRDDGTHTFTVNAESEASGETYSVNGVVNVIRNHDVTVEVENPGTVCRGEEAVYTVFVTNGGTQAEQFRLSADAGSFSQETVRVETGETEEVLLTRSSSMKVTDRAFNIRAESTSSYAEDVTSTSFTVEQCYESETTLSPQSQEAAALTEAEFDVTVSNEGTRSDSFELSTNYGELEDTEINVAAGDSRTTELTYTPQNLQDRDITVTAEGSSTSEGSASLDVFNGQNVSVEFTDASSNVCEDTRFERELVLENNGAAADTYTVSSSRGNLSDTEVELDVGETRRLEVDLHSSDFNVGRNYDLSVTAQSQTFDQPRNSGETSFKVENCYDLKMDVVPHVASAGENRSVLYEVRLENTGTMRNDYTVTAEGPEWISVRPEQVTVDSSETGKSYIYAGIPYDQADNGTVRITATAEGEMVTRSKEVRLVLGDEVRDAINSGKGGITGMFTNSLTGVIDAVTGASNLTKLLISLLVGLGVSAVILYHEW